MMRLNRMAPVLIIAAGFLALVGTGIPLYPRVQPLLEHFEPGVVVNQTPPSPDAAAALDRHVKSELSTAHAAHGYAFVVALWFLVPLAGAFPLALAWRTLPGNRGRIAGFSIAAAGVLLALFLMASLTGHELAGLFREPTGISRVAVRRSLVLHAISIPVMLGIVLGALVWAHAWIAKRTAPPAPGPASDPRP